MGLLEPITHKKEIEKLLDDAQNLYNCALSRLDSQKKSTSKSLESLGEQRLESWSEDMPSFLTLFNLFDHAQIVNKKENIYLVSAKNQAPPDLMLNIKTASLTATEILNAGTVGLGTGVLLGIASYGGAAMFAHASTGTAIATLSGAAKKNATLAWFGGGSLASGGLGKAGGKLVICGIVAAPLLIVSGLLAASKGAERLAEAKRVYSEAEKAVAQINSLVSEMQEIQKAADKNKKLLRNLSSLFRPFISEIDKISKKHAKNDSDKIIISELSEMEQKTLHQAWLIAQLYYHGLSAAILSADGQLNPEANIILKKIQKDYNTIASNVAELNKEKQEVQQLLSSARSTFERAIANFSEAKLATQTSLLFFGRQKFDFFRDNLQKYLYSISAFDCIDIANTLKSELFCDNVHVIIDYLKRAHTVSSSISINSISDSLFVELAAFRGVSSLVDASYEEESADYFINAAKHDLSLWFTEELNKDDEESFVFENLSMTEISQTETIIDAITGDESLAQAKEIHNHIAETANKINAAVKILSKIAPCVNKSLACTQKIQALLDPFILELNAIAQNHNYDYANPISFQHLTKAEQTVLELFSNILKLQYYIFTAEIFSAIDQCAVNHLEYAVLTANKELRTIRQITFKMTGAQETAANLIWKPLAQKVAYINFSAIALFLLVSCIQLLQSKWTCLIGIISAVIACPFFFYYKISIQSKLFLWRIVRFLAAIFAFIGLHLLTY